MIDFIKRMFQNRYKRKQSQADHIKWQTHVEVGRATKKINELNDILESSDVTINIFKATRGYRKQ